MSSKFYRDISASSAQVIVNQTLGLAIFIIISRFLPKDVYGEFNWTLATLMFVASILSFRLEQIVVRRIASGDDPSKLLTLFIFHQLFSGLTFFLVLLIASQLYPSFFIQHPFLIQLAIAQLFNIISSPFKQVANGKEEFQLLAIMSMLSNIIRFAGLLLIIFTKSLQIEHVIIIYIISSIVEFVASYYIVISKMRVGISLKYGLKDYFILIRQSLPQVGMVIFNASIARMDWILLGLLSTSFMTADYSFAYRIFELSPLPLLVIAPILLSRFSKFFKDRAPDAILQHKDNISTLIRLEMLAAVGIPLLINLVWAPLVDAITDNKYGTGNELTFLLLSCCIPFFYLNNLLWSVHFAQNRLGLIFRITLVTFVIIFIGDLATIPAYGAHGAAAVYLLATVVEYINYLRFSLIRQIRESWQSPLIHLAAAAIAGIPVFYLVDQPLLKVALAVPIYCLLLLATKQLRSSDLSYVFRIINRK